MNQAAPLANYELPAGDVSTEPAVEAGMGLCLSGGGYRAMLFHVGVLWRLYDTGLLAQMKRISSVSGGSITAAQLALRWSQLSFDPTKAREDFVPLIVEPIRDLADETIDVSSVAKGALWFGTIAEKVAEAYEKHLYGPATLQAFPDEPRFVLNATNVQSGALWRFSKRYMRDYRVGEVKQPKVRVAQAVAASSAFPPFLSPMELTLSPSDFTPGSGDDLQREPFTRHVVLTDGGVYDNLGLETVWKRYQTVFVSNAGGKMAAEAQPDKEWLQHTKRILDVVDNQVRSLRVRHLIEGYKAGRRNGAYWGIRSNIHEFSAPCTLPAPYERTLKLAEEPTRLATMAERKQQRLINWGYAVTDAAVRSYHDSSLAPPAGYPYPDVGV